MKTPLLPPTSKSQITTARVSGRSPDLSQLKIQTGEIVTGKVVRSLEGNQSVMNIGGTNLVVETDVPLSAGDQVTARVASTDHPIVLRIVSADAGEIGHAKSVTDILNEFNIPATDLNKSLVKGLIQHNFAVNQENLASLLNYVQMLENATQIDVNQILIAWKMNIPPQSNLFQAFRSLFQPSEKFGSQIDRLKNSLRQISANLPNQIDSNLIEQILALIQSDSSEAIEQKIVEFLSRLGRGYEKGLLQSPQISAQAEAFKNTLKGLLLRLRNQISEISSEDRTADLTQLLDLADEVLSKIDAQEIASSRLFSSENQIYLQIPYHLTQPQLTAEVLAHFLSPRSGPDDETDQTLDNVRFEMLIETENLGTLKLNLHIHQRNMRFKILTENVGYNSFIDQEKSDLLDRMEGLDYNVNDISLQVAEENQMKIELIQSSVPMRGEVVQIDVVA